ncbi:hypothetical protein [Amycolatopsis sp. NPDC058986]|uniref:hypothetical protein n=1 Tax=unclassified Amycolatopsis TaxID=2618356 RepID=UPI003670553E
MTTPDTQERITFRGMPLGSVEVDVAELLLALGARLPVVHRGYLTHMWKQLATDIDASPAAALYAPKGSLATRRLAQALAWLERVGAIERTGQRPQRVVRIRDPEALRALIDQWETEIETPATSEDLSAVPHGTASRWRYGCHCTACRTAHNTDTRDWRRRAARIDDVLWAALLHAIRRGTPVREAAARHHLTPHRLYAQARIDPARGRELDAALDAGRDPALDHGTAHAYRQHCRCTPCRAAKARTR